MRKVEMLKNQKRMKDDYSLDIRLVDLKTNACIMQRTNATAKGTLKALIEILDFKD